MSHGSSGAGVNHARLDVMRHSAAHILAKAIQQLYPGSKLGIGPVIENGFYYDIDLPERISESDLPRIEEQMATIVKAAEPFERVDWDKPTALEHYTREDPNPYKREIIEAVPDDEPLSFYRTGTDWIDLCRGPHVDNSKDIGVFKLLNLAGAYWRGDEHRPMLTRIYGTTWDTREQLDHYLWQLEEARRRDHRRLGRELDLFSISEEVGPGLVLWHPKGARIRVLAEDFSRQMHLANGYEWAFTPHIGRAQLWETSGHLGFYRESMFAPMDVEGEEYFAKPMNCPFHIEIFRSRTRSYRELPLRLAEFGTCYRYERSGVLHGLARVRGFTQDDAHIFCRPDQIEDEIVRALDFSLQVLRAFGLTDFTAYLSTRPEKSVGEPAVWERATEALRMAIESVELPYELDEGGGAFYGPKIDLKVHDALGREWQLSTIQFDFNEPERFRLEFVGDDGQPHRPFMVHRALMGSMERFLAVLIEHYAGAFPLWIAPVQAVVVPIADRHTEYAESVAAALREADFRVEVDTRREKMQAKIRDAQTQQVPYMLVVGDRDQAAGTVSVRERRAGDQGAMRLADLIEALTARRARRT
jgi:threonyl-tRNA synthetase